MEKAFLVPPEDSTDKYPELVMKCIWKLTKCVSAQLAAGMDIKSLLKDIQELLSSIPPMEWKSRTTNKLPYDDMPLKTLKTILHELTHARGLEILAACNELFESNSYTSVYVKTFLKSAHIFIPEEMENSSTEKVTKKRQRSRASSDAPELSPAELDERLKDICGRICSKPDTRAVQRMHLIIRDCKTCASSSGTIPGPSSRLTPLWLPWAPSSKSTLSAAWPDWSQSTRRRATARWPTWNPTAQSSLPSNPKCSARPTNKMKS